jgi:hypothetical protein
LEKPCCPFETRRGVYHFYHRSILRISSSGLNPAFIAATIPAFLELSSVEKVEEFMVMKRNICCLLVLGFLSLSPAIQNSSPENAKPSPLPEQISRYYEGYNFVSSFSTMKERSQLIAYLKGQGQPGSNRLKKILDLMKKLQAQIQSIDPKMVVPPYQVVYIDYAGIAEVESLSITDDKATVRVTIYGLEPEANTWLISQYDQSGRDEQKLPTPEKRLDLAKTSKFRRSEVHLWAKFKDGWKKNEANLIPLKN